MGLHSEGRNELWSQGRSRPRLDTEGELAGEGNEGKGAKAYLDDAFLLEGPRREKRRMERRQGQAPARMS